MHNETNASTGVFEHVLRRLNGRLLVPIVPSRYPIFCMYMLNRRYLSNKVAGYVVLVTCIRVGHGTSLLHFFCMCTVFLIVLFLLWIALCLFESEASHSTTLDDDLDVLVAGFPVQLT